MSASKGAALIGRTPLGASLVPFCASRKEHSSPKDPAPQGGTLLQKFVLSLPPRLTAALWLNYNRDNDFNNYFHCYCNKATLCTIPYTYPAIFFSRSETKFCRKFFANLSFKKAGRNEVSHKVLAYFSFKTK